MLNNTWIDYYTVEELARRALRRVLQHYKPATPEGLMKHPAITALPEQVRSQILAVSDHPRYLLNQEIWELSVAKEYWIQGEAAAIAAGLDPIYVRFAFRPYRQRWTRVHCHTLRAVFSGALVTELQGKRRVVTPSEFSRWVLATDLVHESALPFFKELSLRPEHTVQCNRDCLSPGSTYCNAKES